MAEILDFNKMMFNSFEPKMKNRFILEIDGLDAYTIKTAKRPSIQFETVVIDHINIKRKLQGKGEWQNIDLTLLDPIVPSAAQKVMEWVRSGHESLTGRRGYADFYKKNIKIKVFGPPGDVVEQWDIKGAFIESADFGELDWSSNDPNEISLTIAYDYAVLEF